MSNAQGISTDLKPLKEALKRLDAQVRDKVVRNALTAGADVLQPAAQAAAPRATGLLAESVERKVKIFPRAGVGYAMVGPASDIGAVDAQGKWRVPAKYNNPLHSGHINADGSFTPGNPWVKRVTESNRDAVQSAITGKLASGIERAAAAAGSAA